MNMIRSRTLAAALLAATPLALSGCAQSNAQETDRFAGVEIKTEQLADGVAVMFGAGGNIGVSYGPDGTVLIDDQFAPLTPKIQAAVAALGADPVKYLINTHWHGDHTGGNENFGKAGALIMAHDHVRERMLGIQKTGRGNDPASPKEALPVVTYHDGLKLHLNGDEVHVKHMRHAHTDGDSIIFWKKANVLHMGDLYFNKVTLPFIDLNSGGNARGVLAAAEKALKMGDENTKVIPGHGPMATKADLAEYRDMVKTVIGAVESAMAEGKSLEEIQAMKPAAKWDTNPKAFIKGDAFVEAVFKSLELPPHDESHHD
ncbi:Glyoxylase, beta-lactamase superfamily II [Parasphingorhabdus marina DSM 22363]|uniref:beta-lactamase n=1 Tax=Parasphingorhabdus marina DSM 22363 TaxID=1123272 RepID=A0A1N6GM79_9SPHN|nr:MBL fold metallo-hydrolase [Parasphingorhabdus marina]SIO08628.1 Glyoxylase, beta-lactamase superfamily II [Parasphingorhabdus marina DSM 22363]